MSSPAHEESPARSKSVGEIVLGKKTSIRFEDGEVETIGSRISKIGFGWYQIQAYALCCGFIASEGAELSMASGIVNAVGADLAIPKGIGRSMLMTSLFIGLAVGTLVAGPTGDYMGRRSTMFMGYTGILTFSVALCFSAYKTTQYVLNICLGISAGLGIPVAFIVISEVTPCELRGIGTAAAGFAFCIGELWAAIGLRLFNPDLQQGPWRLLVMWAAIPTMVMLSLGMCMKAARFDTAHWLGTQGRNVDTVNAINLMAELNGRKDLKLELHETLAGDDHKTSKSVRDAVILLGNFPLRSYAAVLSMVFFAKDFAFYGTNVFWPLAWSHVKALGTILPATELILTAALGFPGFFLAMCLMNKLPRRIALAGSAAICAIALCLLTFLEQGSSVLGVGGVVIFKLFFPTWQMVCMLLPSEIFPMQIKTCGYAIVASFGRVATITAPFVVGSSHWGFLASTAALAGLVVLICHMLPETRAADLENVVDKKDAFEENAKLEAGRSGCAAKLITEGDAFAPSKKALHRSWYGSATPEK